MATSIAEKSSSVDVPVRLACGGLANQQPAQEPVITDKQSAMDTTEDTITEQAEVEVETSAGQLPQPSVEQRDDHEARDQAPTSEQDVPPCTGVMAAKKKKRTKRAKSQRGRNKPTGFEEFYADPPLTPAEHKEEREIYDVSRPIIHRMEEAILRFQKKRRIEPERLEVFLKYLAYGGVNVNPKMFGGVDNRDLEAMDAEQILVATGQTNIDRDRSALLIDFDAVVRGYLTSFFPFFFNPETEDEVKLSTSTIRNFLSYLLHHEVCPEYRENIDQARTSGQVAEKELWKNQQLTANGPGHFNTACSQLFGGYFFSNPVEEDQLQHRWKNPKDDTVRMTDNVARKVVKFAIAAVGSDSQATRFQALANIDQLRAMQVEDIDGFEITAVVRPDNDALVFYKLHAPDLEPVGKILAKAFRDPGKPPVDLSQEEIRERERESGGSGEVHQPEFVFFFEESLLQLCYPGMKIITSVWQMNCGLHYFDEVFKTYCSIYTVLCNDLMLGWKKPREVLMVDPEEEEEAEDGKGSKETIKNEGGQEQAGGSAGISSQTQS